MNATATCGEPEFKPVTLTIEIKSKQELDFLASLFNHTAVCNTGRDWGINYDGFEEIRDSLSKVGGNMHRTGEFKFTTL